MFKLIRQITNVLNFVRGGVRPLAGPLKVQWDILYRCNSRCVTCDRWKAAEGDSNMPLERELQVIDELAKLGTFSLAFSGGEPFLRKDIFTLFRHAALRGLTTSVNTNGLLINKEVAEKIVESGLDMIYLSLDGGRSETNDYIRGVPGGFTKTFQAVEHLRNARTTKPRIFVNCTVNNRNVSELEDLVKAAQNAGVDGITMQPAHNCDGMEFTIPDDLLLSKENIPLFNAQLLKIKQSYPGMFPMMEEYFANFGTFIAEPEKLYKYRCVAAYTSVQIHPNGDVYSCPVAFEKMGNLLESSFQEIWYSEKANNLRNKIKNGQHPMCWFTCVAPASLLLSDISEMRIGKLLRSDMIKHIWLKISK